MIQIFSSLFVKFFEVYIFKVLFLLHIFFQLMKTAKYNARLPMLFSTQGKKYKYLFSGLYIAAVMSKSKLYVLKSYSNASKILGGISS